MADDFYDYQGEYDNFDSGDFGSLGDTQQFEGWGTGQESSYTGDTFGGYNNYMFDDAAQGTGPNATGFSGTPQNYDSQFDAGQQQELMARVPEGGWGGGISSALSQLFNGLGTREGKGALTGLGALLEGMQNKKKASSVQNIVNQQQQRTDPFGSQRPFYQQQLQQTVQDPYSQPMVASQVAQLQRAQAIKDAAAGRRSNGATSSPALLAAQAQIAQKYMDSLMTPAGANISPNASGLSELLQGNNAGINGYVSPIMSAVGYNSGTSQQQQIQQAIADYMAKNRSV
jgi:hypothetical protein